jgi:hypothetical protein
MIEQVYAYGIKITIAVYTQSKSWQHCKMFVDYF